MTDQQPEIEIELVGDGPLPDETIAMWARLLLMDCAEVDDPETEE